ncbi:hypothetical protein BGZ61DRAFT_529666 [Ilyonectria robusta]|uniref:uncharacterized protein n=1 Tax=Ilyonectria robusta TaxID=1079257 RepID=UPI001E8DBE2F|nr:uncharacterized protein BGZ61DRAFT_529666 [Ilyonectria robusta]KAH8729466.1 hypothetical protein BGZ61DRAFT_529666 [Ilyonectria robusta]
MDQDPDRPVDLALMALKRKWLASHPWSTLSGKLSAEDLAILFNDNLIDIPIPSDPAPSNSNLTAAEFAERDADITSYLNREMAFFNWKMDLMERGIINSPGPGITDWKTARVESGFPAEFYSLKTWNSVKKAIEQGRASGSIPFSTPITTLLLSPGIGFDPPVFASTSDAPALIYKPVDRARRGVVPSPCPCLCCLHSRLD